MEISNEEYEKIKNIVRGYHARCSYIELEDLEQETVLWWLQKKQREEEKGFKLDAAQMYTWLTKFLESYTKGHDNFNSAQLDEDLRESAPKVEPQTTVNVSAGGIDVRFNFKPFQLEELSKLETFNRSDGAGEIRWGSVKDVKERTIIGGSVFIDRYIYGLDFHEIKEKYNLYDKETAVAIYLSMERRFLHTLRDTMRDALRKDDALQSLLGEGKETRV